MLPTDDFGKPDPLFLVEAPDASPSSEIVRQTAFLRDMRLLAPSVLVYANANAGKRAIHTARREGIRGGVFDLCVVWNRGVAWIELKGRRKPRKGAKLGTLGEAGELSDAQIRFGNQIVAAGHHCACFFDPVRAIEWLRGIGAPINLK